MFPNVGIYPQLTCRLAVMALIGAIARQQRLDRPSGPIATPPTQVGSQAKHACRRSACEAGQSRQPQPPVGCRRARADRFPSRARKSRWKNSMATSARPPKRRVRDARPRYLGRPKCVSALKTISLRASGFAPSTQNLRRPCADFRLGEQLDDLNAKGTSESF